MPTADSNAIQSYFWMVHYVTPPTTPGDGEALQPISVGRAKWVIVTVHRNAYGENAVGFQMPREGEAAPNPENFRGAPHCRNRIVGFYSSREEANGYMNEELWTHLRKKGAVYAELHCITVDIARQGAMPERKVA